MTQKVIELSSGSKVGRECDQVVQKLDDNAIKLFIGCLMMVTGSFMVQPMNDGQQHGVDPSSAHSPLRRFTWPLTQVIEL